MPEMLLPVLWNVLFTIFLSAFKQFQLMNLKKHLLCVRGRWLSKGQEDHMAVLMSLPTHQSEKKLAVTRGHPDINREAETSSFNTPRTASRCFIPLTCLYVCFLLCSLTRGVGGEKEAAKILIVNNSSRSLSYLERRMWCLHLKTRFGLSPLLSEAYLTAGFQSAWCDRRWHCIVLGTGWVKRSWKGAVKFMAWHSWRAQRERRGFFGRGRQMWLWQQRYYCISSFVLSFLSQYLELARAELAKETQEVVPQP